MIAESIAHYRIINKLGRGGIREVYLTLDTKLDRKVATLPGRYAHIQQR